MTEAEIYEGLTGVFRDAFGSEDIVLTPQTHSGDIPGWDSIKMVAILMGVEQRFGIRLRSRDVDNLDSVEDLVDVIKTKLG